MEQVLDYESLLYVGYAKEPAVDTFEVVVRTALVEVLGCTWVEVLGCTFEEVSHADLVTSILGLGLIVAALRNFTLL